MERIAKSGLSKYVLSGIALHLDCLNEAIKNREVDAAEYERQVVESLMLRVDGYQEAFENPIVAMEFQARTKLMLDETMAFYARINSEIAK